MIDYRVTDLGNGKFDVNFPLDKVTDKAELLFQQVDLILATWKSDFLYNINTGIDYEAILGNTVDISEIEIEYYATISVLQFFLDLKDFTIESTIQRELKISFIVVAESGEQKQFEQVA